MRLESIEDFESPADYAAYLQEFINECGREIDSLEQIRVSAEERLLQTRMAEDNEKYGLSDDIVIGETQA